MNIKISELIPFMSNSYYSRIFVRDALDIRFQFAGYPAIFDIRLQAVE